MGHARVTKGFLNNIPVGLQCGIPHQWGDPSPAKYNNTIYQLKLGNYTNWTFTRMFDLMYNVPQCYLMNKDYLLSKQEIINEANLRPYRYWLAGNEPHDPYQSDNSPSEAALFLRQWRTSCPGSQIIFGGVNWYTNNNFNAGKDWMDKYIALDSPAPDMWHFHIHFLTSVSDAEWRKAEIDQFLKLVPTKYRKPYLITEMAAWPGISNEVLVNKQLVLWAAKKLVSANYTWPAHLKGVHWYCANDPFNTWDKANLMTDSSSGRTSLGNYFLYIKNLDNPANEPYPIS